MDRYGNALPAETAGLEWKPSGDVFESVRHTWEVVSRWGVRFASPWTRVNNCTRTNSVRAFSDISEGKSQFFSEKDNAKRTGSNRSAPAGMPPSHNRMIGAFEYDYRTA